ncbi:MAG: hypothetical protein ACFFEV_06995 [Candidatus Thorarchaeota archaeon]
MDDRYKNAPSPRRGQYGDTTQRCAWCGKATTYGQRACVGGAFERNYCSYSCMAAGDLYVLATIAVIFPLVMFFIYSWGLPVDFLLFFLGIPEIICLLCVCLGHSERKRDEYLQEELRRSGHI